MNKLLIRFYRTSSKFNLKLTSELEEIIIGLMLGDLHAEKLTPNSNTRLQFKQSIKNKNYIDHLYSLYKIYCNSEPTVNTSLDKRAGKRDLNVSIKIWTSSIPCFNKFRELFYESSGKKHVPLELEKLITPRSLAYWAMDDGYKTNKGF
uniref:LAGLIDADG endonuclease n=1 Tax=Phellinus igniarius TaxID=40472 RepID=UPI00233EE040|nr:LAGLIDADG endonuclease [Phellinus igniarius]WBU93176.1 LAGLIDADG endonuclease [Phellinus igniarius]